MINKGIRIQELSDILEKEKKENDLARIVNPFSCGTLNVENGVVSSNSSCYQIWNHNHRCTNCHSKRACIQNEVLHKTEILDNKLYKIKTTPYKVIMDDNEEKQVVIESVNISELSDKPVNMDLGNDPSSSVANSILFDSQFGIIHLNAGHQVVFANSAAKNMLLRNGEDSNASITTTVNNWLDGRLDAENPDEKIFVQRYEYDQTDYFFNVQIIPFSMDDGQNYVFLLQERTQEDSDLLAKLRDYDPITGVFNESGFQNKLQKILKAHPDNNYTLMCLQMNNFKTINSVFGANIGNAILCRVAEILTNIAEDHGCVCHFYSNQFGLFTETPFFDREKLALDLESVKNAADGLNLGLNFQIGVYQLDDYTLSPEIICGRAALAVRNTPESDTFITFTNYTKKMSEDHLSDSMLLPTFEKAVGNDEFKMYLQPQTDRYGNLLGAEALARWYHAEEGVVPPGSFIHRFEKKGIIYRLDKLIWEKAAALLASWKNTSLKDISISVNVSPLDISLMDIVDTFKELVQKYDIDPGLMHIEITENAMIDHAEQVIRTVNRLNQLGFKVEIDDFGSGYSSLNMLKDLHVDTLKIDRGFLEETAQKNRSKTILSAIIRLASDIGMSVVTEGVETEEMLNSLCEMGCEIFQGFYFSKPVTIEDFEKKYR
jgi:EAL domain-containing protein (putative c-di-GMP-specific phosphodiesterase class I)/GGDEF domain-containing protein